MADTTTEHLGREYHATVNGETFQGVCIDVDKGLREMVDTRTGESWPGIRFRLRWRDDETGRYRTRWTPWYPDRPEAVPVGAPDV